MDSKTLTTTIWVLGIIALLVIIIRWNNVKKKNKVLKELCNYAEEAGCKISEYDYWYNTKIGMDRDNQRLFFIRNAKEIMIKKMINLSEIQKSRVNNTTRLIGEGKNTQSVVDKIELSFTWSEKNKPITNLEFYNNEYDSFCLAGELQLAEKWSGIVNSVIAVKNR